MCVDEIPSDRNKKGFPTFFQVAIVSEQKIKSSRSGGRNTTSGPNNLSLKALHFIVRTIFLFVPLATLNS